MVLRLVRTWTACIMLSAALPGGAQDAKQYAASPEIDYSDPTPVYFPGHSIHGEAFNEGPRQRAYLMKGMGKIRFPITTNSPLAQRFFEQGVAQLHGFWYFEAERSFRQVAAIDPECAMAYWGMAMANVNNEKRAKEFIQRALRKKPKASEREHLWIDALTKLYEKREGEQASKKQRLLDLYGVMRRICTKYPEDIEAKAFLACIHWENQGATPIGLPQFMDASLKSVLAVNPMHPAHHYRIHLWDGRKTERALDSAARCGQSTPGIAHMWHMPGHIYSGLQRYRDACWQQEAGVRVDNAQLIRDRILPDQIHNYAHNSEWLIRDLINVGRVHDAIALSKNMIEMPRHPKFNTVDKGSSTAGYGRLRLLQVLSTYELWDETLALGDTVYIEPTNSPIEKVKRLQALAVAHFALGEVASGDARLKELEAMSKTEGDAKPPFNLDSALSEARMFRAVATNNKAEAQKQLDMIGVYAPEKKAWVYLQIGNLAKAEEFATDAVKQRKNEVQPLAMLVEVLHRAGKKAEAAQRMKELQSLSADVDLDAPIFRRVSEIAPALGFSADWRVAVKGPEDVGKRPFMDSLGPFQWSPAASPQLSLPDATGRRVSLADYKQHGKPVLVIFYLGSGCKLCMEQLNVFAPVAKDFEKAGISLLAVSTDTVEGLQRTFPKDGAEKPFTFPLLSDKDQKSFKAFRAYDDFEKTPLHGCYLIDGKGYVRWQDIGFEPFKDPTFLLEEAQRLLKISAESASARFAGHIVPSDSTNTR